ncbi:UDP-N-acetylmuramoyl-L-alanyl-D-glutamate--2,6-diaminopimelate ligase [Gammaproteobacteria bacterium]|nr:UDP-N-acetylmuramoyl-L-alanyl-D-glutamate--2,6-diaminopimelate ligase [Gammaproteobacteria bacterium]
MEILLSELICGKDLPDILLNGISADSRKIKKGELFVSLSGREHEGNDFISDALSKGAAAVITDKPSGKNNEVDLPIFCLPNLRKDLGKYASRFFGSPSRNMQIIALTGTNGKTSVTHFLAQVLKGKGFSSGIIGSLGYGDPEELIDTDLTTPDAIRLQGILRTLSDKGFEHVFLEASSHGLHQSRLSGVDLDIAVLTNITQDHLDYHETMDQYREAKAKLFTFASLKKAVINKDDEYSVYLRRLLSPNVEVKTFGRTRSADIVLISESFNRKGISLRVSCSGFEFSVDIALFGTFNVENILATVATLNSMGWSGEEISNSIGHLVGVPGRMELVSKEEEPTVFLDYAHTPDGLEKALRSIREHFGRKKLTCIFGCGGDRDPSKRNLMGKIASQKSDVIILTNDNPRGEVPENIIRDIREGISGSYLCELDRAKAIKDAIRAAKNEDVILVAGKGREMFQQIGSEKIPYQDLDSIRIALETREHV